ncbi:MAG: hypothetical protein IJB96_06155 [Lachnospira sp.]|nr:hypothetical protein [Lachnospira sp.]
MKKAKRIKALLAGLLAVILVVTSVAVYNLDSVHAAEGATLSVTTDKTEVKAGDVVTATVSLADNTGFAGLSFYFKFDTNVFEFYTELDPSDEYYEDDLFTEVVRSDVSGDPTLNFDAADFIGCVYAFARNNRNNGELVVFRFKAKADATIGETTFDLTYKNDTVEFINANYENLPLNVVDAKVAVVCAQHTLDAGTITTEATCFSKGVKTYKCTNTGCTYSETEDIAATGNHTLDAGTVTTEATCFSKGVLTKKCTTTGCTYSETSDIAATGNHTWDAGTVTTEATCNKAGVKTYKCTTTGCTETKTETIPATGTHVKDAGTVTTKATCTTDGVKSFKCTGCGTAMGTEVIPATGHAMDTGKVTTEATCAKDGVKTYSCTNEGCTHTTTEVIPATGVHTSDEGKVTTEPTCTTEGVKTFSCTVCSAVIKTEAVPVVAHTFGTATVTKAPTCTEAGEETGTCTVCGKTTTQAVAATGHTSDEGKVTTEPTCKTEGVKTFSCTVCSAVIKTEAVPVVDHTWDEGKTTKEPTINEEGEKTYTCTVCNDTKTEAIAKLPADEGSNTGDATPIMFILMLLVASGASLAFFSRKRTNA